MIEPKPHQNPFLQTNRFTEQPNFMLLLWVVRIEGLLWVGLRGWVLQWLGSGLSFDNVILGVVGLKLSTWLTLWRRRKWISKLIVVVIGSNGSNPFGFAICDSRLVKFAGGFLRFGVGIFFWSLSLLWVGLQSGVIMRSVMRLVNKGVILKNWVAMGSCKKTALDHDGGSVKIRVLLRRNRERVAEGRESPPALSSLSFHFVIFLIILIKLSFSLLLSGCKSNCAFII